MERLSKLMALNVTQLTPLDFVFGVIILVSTVVACFKGLARELISLGALIVGLIAAAFYYPRVGAWFRDLTSSENVSSFIGFMIIFLGCLIVGGVAAHVVKRLIKMAALTWVDRILGAIFGFVRGWALASIIVLALVAFPIRENRLARSYLGPYLLAGARGAVLLVPGELKEKFRSGYKQVLDALNQTEGKT